MIPRPKAVEALRLVDVIAAEFQRQARVGPRYADRDPDFRPTASGPNRGSTMLLDGHFDLLAVARVVVGLPPEEEKA